MDIKNLKSREEWKKLANELDFSDFQNLVYELLKALGFTQIKQRGSGPDGGRDLEAYYTYRRPNGDQNKVKCWIQCKKQAAGVSFSQIHEDITRASSQKIDEFYIISNFDTTPDCKDEIERGQGSWSCKIIDWTGLKFQDILFSYPDICKYYFPDEEVPPITNVTRPSEAISLSTEMGKKFGIEFQFKTKKPIDLNNPAIVADDLKEALLGIHGIDINLQALIYHKISMFFYGLERAEDALMFINKSLDITPKNIEALLNKGYILGKVDEIEESNKCYDEVLDIDPNNKFALNNKAINLRRLGVFEEALELADRSLRIDPNFINAIANKAEILKGLKKSKEALSFLDEKKDFSEKSVNLKETRVLLFIDLLDLREAYRLNEEILARYPDNINAMNNKGVIFERNSRFQYTEKYLKLATEWFEKTVEKNNKFPVGFSNKAVVNLKLREIDEAEKIIDYAYTLFPKHPQVLCKKGVVLLNRKKPKEASKYFDKALRIWFDEEFLLNKALSELNQRHNKEAKETAEKLLKYNPEESQAWVIKGQALRRLHQPAMASICFKNAEKYKKRPTSLLED